MGKRIISLAVAESQYGHSPLALLESAGAGEINIYAFIGYSDSESESQIEIRVPINVKPLLKIIKHIGADNAFKNKLNFDYDISSKIFSTRVPQKDGSCRSIPSTLRLKENLFIELSSEMRVQLFLYRYELGMIGSEENESEIELMKNKKSGKLIDIFRDKKKGIHHAWGTLIKQKGKGYYTLDPSYIPTAEDFTGNYYKKK